MKLRDWLFADYKEQLDREKEIWKEKVEKDYTDKAILHFMRRKYKGFDPSLLLNDEEILAEFNTQERQMTFLENCKKVIENEDFRKMMEHLYTRQLVNSALESEDIDAVNFGRATINGLALVEENLTRYTNIYYERTQRDPEYDKYEII